MDLFPSDCEAAVETQCRFFYNEKERTRAVICILYEWKHTWHRDSAEWLFCSCVFRAVCTRVSKSGNFIIDLAAGEVLLVNPLLVTDSTTPQGLC